VASLLTGGVVLHRKQRQVRLTDQASAIATEFELTEPFADDVFISTEAEVEAEKEVVLTR
jgi:hypothetical protein